jgi:hypothetical protein
MKHGRAVHKSTAGILNPKTSVSQFPRFFEKVPLDIVGLFNTSVGRTRSIEVFGLNSTPEAVDPVGNPPSGLTENTVALPVRERHYNYIDAVRC